MKKRAGRPYADTRLAAFLEKRILELKPKKSQLQIATEAGFVQPNMLSMFKNGSNKLPLDRVTGLAKALDCDPALLFKLALEQLDGDTTASAIQQIFGTVVSRNEVAWLEEIRKASGNSDPTLTAKRRLAIRGIFREMNSALSIRKVPEHGRVSLTVNEWAWIDFIRLISYDSDPAPTLHRIQNTERDLPCRCKSSRKKTPCKFSEELVR
jgi:transcriptional regulator with XRE-family HTH domain